LLRYYAFTAYAQTPSLSGAGKYLLLFNRNPTLDSEKPREITLFPHTFSSIIGQIMRFSAYFIGQTGQFPHIPDFRSCGYWNWCGKSDRNAREDLDNSRPVL